MKNKNRSKDLFIEKISIFSSYTDEKEKSINYKTLY